MTVVSFGYEAYLTTLCAGCGVKNGQAFPVPAFSVVPLPTLPDDWNIVNGHPFCPDHTVSVTDPRSQSPSRRGRA